MKKALFFLVAVLALVAGAALADDAKGNDAELVGYDGGFFIQNRDRSFVFKTNGRFIPRLYYSKITGNDSDWSFKIRSVKLDFNATVFTDTSFGFSLEHATESELFTTVNITGAVLAHKFAPEFTVSIGMVGLPLSIIDARGTPGLIFVDKPLIISQVDLPSNQMTPLRSSFGAPSGLGICLEGTFFDKLYYNLSVVNGASKATPATIGPSGELVPGTGGQESDYSLNFNKRVSAGVRLAYDILDPAGSNEEDFPYSERPKWTVSAGGDYQGKRQDPNFVVMPTVDYIITGSVGTSFKWRGFAINSEAYGRKTKIGDPGSAVFYSNILDDMGYYVDVGYFIIPDKLEIGILASQLFREGPHNNSYQFAGSINWFPLGKPNMKLQLGYSYANYYKNITQEAATKGQSAVFQLVTTF